MSIRRDADLCALSAQTGERSMSTTTEYISVATTRPETILGDTAVAVNPNDPRYKDHGGALGDSAGDRARNSHRGR